MKKLVWLILTMCLCLACTAAMADPNDLTGDAPLVTEEVGWTWDDQALGVLTITGDGEMEDYTDETPAPWTRHAKKIDRIVIGDGITRIGANAFKNLKKTVRVDFLQDTAPEIDETAFAGTTAVCRYYTENEENAAAEDCWPADGEYANGEGHTLSWIYLPVYDPYQEENGFAVTYARPEGEPGAAPGWTVQGLAVSAAQAAEISYRGRSVYLEAMPGAEEYTALCDDWDVVYGVTFDYECAGEKEIRIPAKNNPIPQIRCAGAEVELTINVDAGGKVRLEVDGGEVTCNGDVEQLDMDVVLGDANGLVDISGDVDKLYISRSGDGHYYGTLTIGGMVGEGLIFADAQISVDKLSPENTVQFDHIAVQTIPSGIYSGAVISDGELHISGLGEAGDWQDTYLLLYGADYSNGSWTVCLMPKGLENTMASSYVVELDEFSIDQVIYGNTSLVIENYTGEDPLPIGDPDDPTLGIQELGIHNSRVTVNCPVYSVATTYGENSRFDITINSSVDQLWINGDDPDGRVILGTGGFVQDGWMSRPLRDQYLFGPIFGPKTAGTKNLYMDSQLLVPCHKINQTISYILPSDAAVSAAANRSAIMDLEQGPDELEEDEQDALAEAGLQLNPGERIYGVADVSVWAYEDEQLGEKLNDPLDTPVDIALVAPAGTRVVRLHESGEDEEKQITADALEATPAADGTVHVSSDRFSKYLLIDSNQWDYEYVPDEKLLKITGSGAIMVNGAAPWIYEGYDIDRVEVGKDITKIGPNVFTGLKDRVRIDFLQDDLTPDDPETEESEALLEEGAFGDTTAVCRYTSTDPSWDSHPDLQNITWAWMPTFNFAGAGTFGPLWYAKNEVHTGWSVKVEAESDEDDEEAGVHDLTPATAHEILLYCTDLFLADDPGAADLATVIGNTETDLWILHIDSTYNGTLKLNVSNDNSSIPCAILPWQIFVYSSDAVLDVTDTRANGIGRLEIRNGTVNYTGNVQKLALTDSDTTDEAHAAVTVTGTVNELAFYGGSTSPFDGSLTLNGSGSTIRKGFVYTDGAAVMEIPGVTKTYPISTGCPSQTFENLTVSTADPLWVINTGHAGTEEDPVVNGMTGLIPAPNPTIDQFGLRYVIGGEVSWLTLTPMESAGIGGERIEIPIDGVPEGFDLTEPYNPDFMKYLDNNIYWGNHTDICVAVPEAPAAGEDGGGVAIELNGSDGKGINEFSATGWCTVTVRCPVNNLQLQPDPGTFGEINLVFENKIRDAYIQPNNCMLNIVLQNGGSISGGRWKQLMRDYRNFDAHYTAPGGYGLDLVKDGALAVMSYTDWETLRAILPSDALVTAAVNEQGMRAMATLTERYEPDPAEYAALDSVEVEPWQVVSTFDVSVTKYTVAADGEPTEQGNVTTPLGTAIPVTIGSGEDMPDAYVVRLHEDGGEISATKLDTMDLGNAKQFSSNLFSTYVLVDPDAENPDNPDDPNPPAPGNLSLRVVYGTEETVNPEGENDYKQYSGCYYYKVYFDGVPEDADGIYICRESSSAVGPSYVQPARPISTFSMDSEGGIYELYTASTYAGAPDSEAIFARLSPDDEWEKVVLVYDRDAVDEETASIITNVDPPVIWENYTLTWTGLQDADQYYVYWQTPNSLYPYDSTVPGDSTSLSLYDMSSWQDEALDTTAYAGQYRTWVTALAGGRFVTTAEKTLTAAVPQGDEQLLSLTCDKDTVYEHEGDEEGFVVLPVHDKIHYRITADVSILENIREIRIMNGERMETADLRKMENGYVTCEWTPEKEPEGTYDEYTAYAAALIEEEGKEPRWVFTNTITVRVTMDADEIEGLEFTVENAGAQETEDGWTVSIPRDSMLEVSVTNEEGVAYYGVRIDEWGDTITDSYWVPAEADGTTQLMMPLFNTWTTTYEAYVYAVKPGAPIIVAGKPIYVTVTEPETYDPILLAVKSQFNVNEQVRIQAIYENVDYDDPTIYDWRIRVSVYEKGHPDDLVWDEDEEYYYYWTDKLRIAKPGTYIVEAVMLKPEAEGEENLIPFEATRIAKEITVGAPAMPVAGFVTPADLEEIEEGAFAGIPATVVEITEKVTSIGENAFTGSQVEQVIIRNKDTQIDDDAFAGCDGLIVFGVSGGEVQQWADRNRYTFYPIQQQN